MGSRWAIVASVLLVGVLSTASHGMMCYTDEVDCPVCSSKVKLQRLGSWGGYIFDEPSKYDLIFGMQPLTDFIVMCRHCGYAQTLQDFENLSPKQARILKDPQRMALRPWLEDEVPFAIRLQRCFETNQALGRDRAFWLWFNRVRIYHLRRLDPPAARAVAREEVALLDELDFPPAGLRRKESLYLKGEYKRIGGDLSGARSDLRKALDASINRETIEAIVVALVLAGGIAGLACRLFTRRKMLCIAVGVVVIALAAVPVMRFRQRLWMDDTYYSRLIQDRLDMLDTPSADDIAAPPARGRQPGTASAPSSMMADSPSSGPLSR